MRLIRLIVDAPELYSGSIPAALARLPSISTSLRVAAAIAAGLLPIGAPNPGYILTTILEQGGCCPPNALLRASRRPEYPGSPPQAPDRCGIGRRTAARCRSR